MVFNNMLSLNDAPNYATWFYLLRMQGDATQCSSLGYCVVYHVLDILEHIYTRTQFCLQSYDDYNHSD